jgi:hypothetical protein
MSHNARTNSGIHSLMTEIGLLPLPEDEPVKREQSLKNEHDTAVEKSHDTAVEKSKVRDAVKDQIGHGEQFD